MIELSHLNLVLSDFSLKNISLSVDQGDFFALIGPTGAGKSLILETMLGMLAPAGGTITLNGTNITGLPPEKRGLGIVYQDFALFPHLNVRKNILYGTAFHDHPQETIRRRLDFLVAKLGIGHLLHRRPTTLSGGEKQRVALARALILEPAALLLDEPLSALDPVLRVEIKDLLRSIHHELGTTMVMVSHSFSDVFYLANKVAILKEGRIVQQGEVNQVFEQPNSRFTAGFVGMRNILDVRIDKDRARTKGPTFILPPGSDPSARFLAIRPEDICPVRPGHNGFENTFAGTVTHIAHQGFYFDIWLEVDGLRLQAVWDKHFVLDQGIEPGTTLDIGFDTHKVHLLPG
jgi:molybdate/tungstate transport system ATP-binding protein